MADTDQEVINETSLEEGTEAQELTAENAVDSAQGADIASETGLNEDPAAMAAATVADDGSSSRPDEHTAESSKIQAQASGAAAVPNQPTDELGVVLLKRTNDVSDLLREKELLLLTYVYQKVPKPYYVRWKQEANQAFAARVRLKSRIAARSRNKQAS